MIYLFQNYSKLSNEDLDRATEISTVLLTKRIWILDPCTVKKRLAVFPLSLAGNNLTIPG
jgi:hypothetical protein